MKQAHVRLVGMLVFLIALATYVLTVEPSISYWDCPEYILVGNRLEVGHPPGNPLWMLQARMASMLAPGPQYVALCINLTSCLFSALTVWLLYLSLTILIGNIVGEEKRRSWLTVGASVAGSLIFCWSDSFWFSAVEAEVYAMSTFFTALMFWLMLVWSNTKDGSKRNRLLLLLAYLTGLSIGVHQLNLLCLPALALIAGFHSRKNLTRLQIMGLIVASLALIGVLLLGLIPCTLAAVSWLELLAVNSFGMPYGAGVVAFALLLSGIGCAALVLTRHRLYINMGVWCLLLVYVGFSVYLIIPIRAAAGPAVNTCSPDNVFSFKSYMEREQYGEGAPLLYGRTPNSTYMRVEKISGCDSAPKVDYKDYARKIKETVRRPYVAGAPYALRGDSLASNMRVETRGHGYLATRHTSEYILTPELDMVFPRIHDGSAANRRGYQDWAGMTDDNMERVEVSYAFDTLGNAVGRLDPLTGKRHKDTALRPTQLQNMQYFFVYQLGYMYLRYLMWNYSGRQNDVMSAGEIDAGNFLTGVPFADDLMLEDQNNLPPGVGRENPGHNILYMVPLLIGILGFMWMLRQGKTGRRECMVVTVLFVMTGVAIVVYLNQTPGEPRDRDYSFLGSYYAYAMWIGAGICALASLSHRVLKKERLATVIALCIGGIVALWMLFVNFDDHDRSRRYVTHDLAWNQLWSCPTGALLFTDGDNNTFPLMYLQEVEDVRSDVTLVNHAYLNAPWFIRQLEMAQVPMTGTSADFAHGMYTIVYVDRSHTDTLDAVEALRDMYERVRSGCSRSQLAAQYLRIAPQKEGEDSIVVDLLKVGKGKRYLLQGELALLDIVATNAGQGWPRAICYTPNIRHDKTMGLDSLLKMHGAVRKLNLDGLVDLDASRHLITNVFRYGNARDERIYIDDVTGRMLTQQRLQMACEAHDMLAAGDTAGALAVAGMIECELPSATWHYRAAMLRDSLVNDGRVLGNMYMAIGHSRGDREMIAHGEDLLHEQQRIGEEYYRYYISLPSWRWGALKHSSMAIIKDYLRERE